MQTPHGIFSMKFFFSSGIDGRSSISIKAMISKIISSENKNYPLSDNKIAEKLKEKYKLDINRRTAAKYRKTLGIEGSRKRKK